MVRCYCHALALVDLDHELQPWKMAVLRWWHQGDMLLTWSLVGAAHKLVAQPWKVVVLRLQYRGEVLLPLLLVDSDRKLHP